MQKEYIEREALEKDFNSRLNDLVAEYGRYDPYTRGFDEAVDRLEDALTADVVEVRHGRWESTGALVGLMNFEYFYRCTACGRRGGDTKTNYCPNCGALMDKEE